MRDTRDWLGGCCHNLAGVEVKHGINRTEAERANVTSQKEKHGWEL